MDTLQAFSMGEAYRGKELKVFDWEKAARLIRESGYQDASAGLGGDWEWTGGNIFTNGKPDMKSYTFLASTWATPEIKIDGNIQECYRMEHEVPRWGAKTKWPKAALVILKEGH